MRNHTQFPSQYFQALGQGDDIYHVLVSRLTYDLKQLDAEGRPALNESQRALVQADYFYGEPNTSSTIEESDFAPFKPKCDILFAHATAYPPKSRAERRWPIGIRVGTCTKALTVTGPRRMDRTLMGWKVTEPEAVREVIVRYERAFGGTCCWPLGTTEDQDPELLLRYGGNPLGCGYAPTQWLRKSHATDIAAPQIEQFKKTFDGIAANTQEYPALGLGAIGRWWEPRIKLAGSYDAQWKEERWPRLPRDFKFAYWNCAPQDQQIAYPAGGEPIALMGLLPDGKEYRACIPDNPPFAFVRLRSGPILFRRMHLDTLIFDMEALTLSCVHRMTVAARADVRVLEIRRKDS